MALIDAIAAFETAYDNDLPWLSADGQSLH
jgi:hypothetical protein